MRACGRSSMKKFDLLAALGLVTLGLILPGALCAADATPDLSGIYWATEYHAKIQVVGGGELPLTAEGKAAYDKNIAGLKDGSIIDIPRGLRVPDGLPRVLPTPSPSETVSGPPGQTPIIYEPSHQIRRVAMDKPMPSEDELETWPFYNGHS